MMQKRSVALFGRETSINLEKEFWDVLELMCAAEGMDKYQMIESIAKVRPYHNLSCSVRVRVLQWTLKQWRP